MARLIRIGLTLSLLGRGKMLPSCLVVLLAACQYSPYQPARLTIPGGFPEDVFDRTLVVLQQGWQPLTEVDPEGFRLQTDWLPHEQAGNETYLAWFCCVRSSRTWNRFCSGRRSSSRERSIPHQELADSSNESCFVWSDGRFGVSEG